MGIRMRWAGIAALMVCLMSAPVPGNAVEISHEQNLGQFTAFVDDASARIEAAAVVSQRAGDPGLAQRQFLIQEMVKRAAAEARFLKQSALASPIHDLTSSQVAKVDELADWLANMDYSDKARIAETTAVTQTRVDGLIDALADGRTYPILFGMLVRDLMDDPKSAPADIEIFGHNIIDPREGKLPTVKVAGNEIPANLITVKGESILADIPDGTRDMIGFSPTPCQPRKTFAVRATAYHGDPHGIWPIRWVSLIESNDDFTALPSPRVYDFSVSYNFERAENTPSTEKFSDRSDYVVAACGQTIATSIRYAAPAGARSLTCKVSWAEATGAKAMTKSCEIAGGVVEARGSLTGPDQICSPDKVCGCIVNARGWLQIDGVYERDNITVLSRSASLPKKYMILANDSTSVPLRMDAGSQLRHIGVLINRRSCPTIYGRLDIQFSGDGQQIMAGVSRSGAFRANYWDGVLTVGNATTEGADPSETSN